MSEKKSGFDGMLNNWEESKTGSHTQTPSNGRQNTKFKNQTKPKMPFSSLIFLSAVWPTALQTQSPDERKGGSVSRRQAVPGGLTEQVVPQPYVKIKTLLCPRDCILSLVSFKPYNNLWKTD